MALEFVVKVTQNFVLSVGVFSVFPLFRATRWHCRLKGKQLLLFRDAGERWETWGKKNKNHTARLKFLLCLGDMRGRVLLSTARPAVWMAASGMFAELWLCVMVMISTDSASANTWELFRAVPPLPWEPMQLQGWEKGDGGTSQPLLFRFACSNPEENSFLSSPSYSCSPSSSHISLGFHACTILAKIGVLWKD